MEGKHPALALNHSLRHAANVVIPPKAGNHGRGSRGASHLCVSHGIMDGLDYGVP